MRDAVNPPIGKALAGNVYKRLIRALDVIHAKRRTVVIAEVEFINVALQVLRACMVKRTNQATLKDIRGLCQRLGSAGR